MIIMIILRLLCQSASQISLIIRYPIPAQPAADDDTPRRADDTTSSSTASCHVANNTLRSTNTNRSDDDEEEDSDEEIGATIYASSNTARDRRAAAEAASVASDQSPSSYEPLSEVRKRKSLSNSSSNSNSKEMESAPKKKRVTKSFDQRVADLRAYKEKHGHVNIKQSDDKSLNKFCINMRYARNNPEKPSKLINDDRISSLDALGFDWSMNSVNIKAFEQRLEELRVYKEKHGHIRVKKSEDKSLYGFCSKMRYGRGNPGKRAALTDDRIASLDDLGFDWRMRYVGNTRLYYRYKS